MTTANSTKTRTKVLQAGTGTKSPPRHPPRQLYELRQPCVLNHFKRAVLGEQHRPGEPQAELVMKCFREVGKDGCLDSRTWRGWFGDPARKASPSSVANLDEYLSCLRKLAPASDVSPILPSPTFYLDLLQGGLLEKLLQRTTSKPPIKTLRHRAFTHQPTSPLHLHLDAIECALWFEPNDVTCEELKDIAGKRVLDLVYDRWKPGGSIYKELSSSFRLQWNCADEQEREGIRKFFSSLSHNRFDAWMNSPPSPDWSRVEVSEDFASSDILKVLLQLAGESEFLVADRFDAWVIDLVSAGVAAYAVLQAKPTPWGYFGVGPASRNWDAVRFLFFSDESERDIRDILKDVFEDAGWWFNDDVDKNLFAARVKYRTWLDGLGLSAKRISEFADFHSLSSCYFVGDERQNQK